MPAGADPGLSRARDGSVKDRWASPCPRQEEARTTGGGVQVMADIYREAAESIVSSDRAAAEAVAQRALDQGIAPGDIMAKGFVKGIQEVGELFESGELFLPELMMSADAMAGATAVTNAALEGAAAEAKGRIVIGTVQGDVHDIGKAIVIAYLKANGYEVSARVRVRLELGDHDRLADVVHVALHGADDDAPLGLGGRAFEGGVGDRGSSGHGVGAHHQLGEEELAALEELADLLDAFDEALRHDVAGGDALVEGALRDRLGGGAI